jgi:hypothetical protein
VQVLVPVSPAPAPPGGAIVIDVAPEGSEGVILTENMRFPTPTCRAVGTYTGHSASAWNQGKHPTSIDKILFSNGHITGAGRDQVVSQLHSSHIHLKRERRKTAN